MAAGIADIGRLVATLGLNSTPFTAGMNAATSRMKQFSVVAMATGRAMTRFVTLPMVLAGGAAVNTQKKFEASMTKIIGLVGVSRTQVEKWNKEVLKMAQATGRGPEELADALYFVTSAGIRGAEAMEVLEMSAKASAAGLGETKVVADLVTSAMNAYGKENLSAAQATDILVASVREGKAEASELAGAMGMVLPIASEFGVSFDQVGAAFAGMTRTGTNARVAATQLKAILSAMASPSMMAADAMAKYGTSADDFRKTIREKGLITALLDLKDATKENEAAMSEIFPNIRALMGVLDLLGANMQYNVQIFEALSKAGGSLERAFAEIEGTTQQKLNVALATFKTTLIGVGEVMKPLVVGILAKLNDKLQTISSSFQAMTATQRKVKLRTLALTAAFGPFLLIVSKMIMIFTALRKALILTLGPYGLLIAAIAAVTLGLARHISKQETANKIYKRSGEVIDDLNASIAVESMRLNMLFEKLKSAKKGTEEWDRAKDKINSTYGKYMENLIGEAASLKKIKEIQAEVTKGRILDIKTKGVATEMERVMEENANDYAKGMKKWLQIVDKGEAELLKRGKNPADFTSAMYKAMEEGVAIWEESAPGWKTTLRAVGEDIYKDFIFGLEGGTTGPSSRERFMQEYFDQTEFKKATEHILKGYQSQLDGFSAASDGITVPMKLEKIDADISLIKEAEKSEGRRSTLISLIGLEKEKNLLLDEKTREVNKTVLEGYEAELRKLDKIASSLGDIVVEEGKIEKLKDARKKLSESELEANSIAIKQAETKLEKLLLETSGLSEIEKARGRIAILQDEGLMLDDAALEKNNKDIADANTKLQLDELAVSGLSNIEKKKERVRIMDESMLYMSKEQYKVQDKKNRLAEQEIRTAELMAAGASDLLMLKDDLAKLEEDARYLNGVAATEQSKLITAKEKEIELQGAKNKGYNEEQRLLIEIASKEDELKTLTGKAADNKQRSIMTDKIALIDQQLMNGLLTHTEKTQLSIAKIELLRAMTINPALREEYAEQLRLLKLHEEVLSRQDSGDTTSSMQFETRGSGDWFKAVNEQIKKVQARQAEYTTEYKEESKALAAEEKDLLQTRFNAYADYASSILNAASALASGMSNIIEGQKQRELSAAGDNAQKREAIEKAYFKKQKRWAMAQAAINTAAAAIQALRNPVPGLKWIDFAAVIAAGVTQMAAIGAQSFADGGIVSGETLARVGEYPGAKSNPEVIAPLSKLKALLNGSGGGMPKEIEFKVKGRDLWAVLKMEENLQNTY